jgi:hypothetical protein
MPDTGNQDATAPEPAATASVEPAAGMPVEAAASPASAPVPVDENYVAPNEYTPAPPYFASDPYAGQNPYAVHNPYAAQAPYAEHNPYAAQSPYAAQPYLAQGGTSPNAPAYQAVPTAPPPQVLTPYTTAGAAYVYTARTNPLAIASLIVSLGSLLVGVLAAIVGVVLGHIALKQIAQRGEAGRGLALGGLITGYVLGGLMLLAMVAYFGLIASLLTIGSY